VTWPTPPLAEQDGRITPVICAEKTRDYFSLGDWTTQISLIELEKLAFTRARN
jgi:hypothetical protein